MGIILDVDLDVVDNEMYLWKTHYLDYKDLRAITEKRRRKSNIGLAYGRLSMSPSTFLVETAIHTYENPHGRARGPAGCRYVWLDGSSSIFENRRHRAALPLDDGKIWGAAVALPFAQRSDEPRRGCFVSRNQEMYDSMDYLSNRLRDTDILQEYFIARQMPQFVDGLRGIVGKRESHQRQFESCAKTISPR
jgi:hypothetical protein